MINKLQKEYLEKRLTNIINKKMDEWDKKHPEPEGLRKVSSVFELLRDKKIKLKKSPSEYSSWYDIRTYFDYDEYQEKHGDDRDKWSKERDAFYNTLKEKAIPIMDKVIFEGLELQDALKEIEAFNI